MTSRPLNTELLSSKAGDNNIKLAGHRLVKVVNVIAN